MAKTITRKNFKIFGISGSTTNFGVFGSQAAADPVKSMDIEAIQALAAWSEGWTEAINDADQAPYIEDMNAAMLVMAYEIGYVLQEGIPEWIATTTYYTGSIVKKAGTLELYGSIGDTNLNHALPSKVTDTYWTYIADLADIVPASFITTARIANDAVNKDKINADVAGNGLGQNADGSLEVKVDGSTVELSSDAVRVKDAGITAAKLNSAIKHLGAWDASTYTYNQIYGPMATDGEISIWMAVANGSGHYAIARIVTDSNSSPSTVRAALNIEAVGSSQVLLGSMKSFVKKGDYFEISMVIYGSLSDLGISWMPILHS